jgi:hypothetical protein
MAPRPRNGFGMGVYTENGFKQQNLPNNVDHALMNLPTLPCAVPFFFM